MPVSKNVLLRHRIIDRMLRNEQRPFPSKSDLRRACEEELYGSDARQNICDSTIEKDLFAMRMEYDAPIQYSRANKGYFYEEKEFTIEDAPLNDKDIEAIKVAANVLSQFKNSSLFSEYAFAIDKIIDRVSISSPNDELDQFVQFETVPTVGGSEWLDKILGAIKSRNRIQFMYQSFTAEEPSVRRLHPYLLKEYRNRWYVIGKNEIKQRIQTFGLDRISSLDVLEDKFNFDESFSPDLFFKYSIGITANSGDPQKVRIKADQLLAKYLLSQPLHLSQEVEEQNDNFTVFSYFLLPTYELKMQLLGFGDEVQVLEPQSLINEIKNTAENIVKTYN